MQYYYTVDIIIYQMRIYAQWLWLSFDINKPLLATFKKGLLDVSHPIILFQLKHIEKLCMLHYYLVL